MGGATCRGGQALGKTFADYDQLAVDAKHFCDEFVGAATVALAVARCCFTAAVVVAAVERWIVKKCTFFIFLFPHQRLLGELLITVVVVAAARVNVVVLPGNRPVNVRATQPRGLGVGGASLVSVQLGVGTFLT